MITIALIAGDLLYDFNASGEVTISRGLEDYPQLSGVTLTVEPGGLSTAKASLIKGATVTALGMQWVIAGLNWQRQHRYQNAHEVVLDLQHPLAPRDSDIVSRRHPLDEPTDISGMLNKGVLNLKSLVTYTGRDWQIPFGIPDDELRVTGRELLEQYKRRLHEDGAFLYWGGTQPEARAWGRQSVHEIPRVLNESLDVEEPGQGAIVDGVQCTAEVVNAEFVPDGDYAQTEYDQCELLPIEQPQNGADNFLSSEAEQIIDGLNKGGVWFDSGGPTKESKLVKQCNGSPVWTRIRKYGLLGSSVGAYSQPNIWTGGQFGRSHTVKSEIVEGERVFRVAVVGMSAFTLASFWGNFSDVTEFVERDNDGYCTARYQVGWTVYRFRTESNAEAQQTYADEAAKQQEYLDKLSEGGDPEEIAELVTELNELRAKNNLIRKAYAGFYLHEYNRQNSRVEYQLVSLSNRYADLRHTRQNPHKYCTVEIAISNWLATMPDPAAFGQDVEEGEAPALLSVGERYEKRKITKIAIPAARGDLRTPERFSVEQRETNAEGSEFKDRITLSPVTYSEGRPTEHDRVITYGWGEGDLPFPAKDVEGKKTMLLNSPGTGYTGSEPPQGEWSSPGVWLQSQAVAAMNLELSIDNTQSAKTTSFTIPADLSIVEGDTLKYQGERWVVLGVSQKFEIERGLARCQTQDCSVGRMMAFGDLWDALYPTEADYPPDSVWPGVGNAPTAASIQRVFTFFENAATIPLSSGIITSEILFEPVTAPAEMPFTSGEIPASIRVVVFPSPAIIPLGSGEVAATLVEYLGLESAIITLGSGQIGAETIAGYVGVAPSIIPLSSGEIPSSTLVALTTRPALMPFTSRTLISDLSVSRVTGLAPISLSSGEVASATVDFIESTPTTIPLSSGEIASAIAVTVTTAPAIIPLGSGETSSSVVVFSPTGFAVMSFDGGAIPSAIAIFTPTTSGVITLGSGEIVSAALVFALTTAAAMPFDSGTIESEIIL